MFEKHPTPEERVVAYNRQRFADLMERRGAPTDVLRLTIDRIDRVVKSGNVADVVSIRSTWHDTQSVFTRLTEIVSVMRAITAESQRIVDAEDAEAARLAKEALDRVATAARQREADRLEAARLRRLLEENPAETPAVDFPDDGEPVRD